MQFYKTALLALLSLLAASSAIDPTSCSDCEVVTRDVAIIGGGSTGTYTALRLRDQNYSVAVIERQGYLGGHAETYTTPNNYTIDIGVIVFANTSTVRNYFSRFNVSLIALGGYESSSYFDFATGQNLTTFKTSSPASIQTGLANYGAQLAKYPGLNSGFNLTYPISADSDLLLPFGQFAAKYNLSGAMFTIFITNQGYAPLLDIPTLYMLKYLNRDQLNSFATGYLTTRNHNIHELYQKAGAYLGTDNTFLNSTVIATDRSSTPAKILIQTPTGRKLIVAKKLVVTAPPMLQTLQNITLTYNETSLFSQFFANGYYTGVMTNTSLPANFGAQAASSDTARYNIPYLPGPYSIGMNQGAPGYVQVYYGSPTVLPSSQVQSDILAVVSRLQKSLGVPQTTPQWQMFKSHAPFNLMVTPAAIQDRFYEKVNALQGVNGTFWNGAAWQTQDSSVLWKFTDDVVVPMVVKSLQ